jgi:hypothetical protein
MGGTRFKLYPQPGFLDDFKTPDIVTLSAPAGTIGPGPADVRMYTLFPIGKPRPYGIAPSPQHGGRALSPPWHGDIHPPAEPDENGHFDYLEPGTPQFEAAHLFGTTHFVLDIWENYFGRPIPWHFQSVYKRLELSILPSLENAYSGFGFIEVGGDTRSGIFRPFSLNFDVIAHEMGHLIIYSEIGLPDPKLSQGEYWGFHESAADLVALISSLHFDSLVNSLLDSTSGNLLTYNVLSRMAEIEPHQQIRIAANNVRLSEFAAGWRKEHLLSQPLTGAFFDIFVDIFHEMLLEQGVITQEMEDKSHELLISPEQAPALQTLFDTAFNLNPQGFKDALLLTRDIVGTYLADTWDRLTPENLTYLRVARTFEQVDVETSGGRFEKLIRGNFDMREIGHVRVGPQLAPFGEHSHVKSVRTQVPRGIA